MIACCLLFRRDLGMGRVGGGGVVSIIRYTNTLHSKGNIIDDIQMIYWTGWMF